MFTRVVHACAVIDGDNTANGTYELNTTDLSGCAGGTFVVTAVFMDSSELFGNSAGTTTIVVQPNCPPVRPCALCFFETACMQGLHSAPRYSACVLLLCADVDTMHLHCCKCIGDE
jgi:hypothetical protein